MNKSTILISATAGVLLTASGVVMIIKSTDKVEATYNTSKTSPLKTPPKNITTTNKEIENSKKAHTEHHHFDADCSHCHDNAKKTNQSNTPLVAKPKKHDLLPHVFDSALSHKTHATNDTRFVKASDNFFNQLSEAKVGDSILLNFTDNLKIEGVVKTLRNPSQDRSLISGMVEFKDYNGKLIFFSNGSKAKADLVFNEKSVAFAYTEVNGEALFIEQKISNIFCSGEDTVYPLNHPSNINTGYAINK